MQLGTGELGIEPRQFELRIHASTCITVYKLKTIFFKTNFILFLIDK